MFFFVSVRLRLFLYFAQWTFWMLLLVLYSSFVALCILLNWKWNLNELVLVKYRIRHQDCKVRFKRICEDIYIFTHVPGAYTKCTRCYHYIFIYCWMGRIKIEHCSRSQYYSHSSHPTHITVIVFAAVACKILKRHA